MNPKPVDTILVSPDKDLLESIGGSHFNYSYKLLDKTNPDSLIKGWWVVTSKEEAELFKLYQLIAGDTSDGVKGIEGKGKKFFEKLEEKSIQNVLVQYIKQYGEAKGIYEFQKNYRLLYLLSTNEDFFREVGYIPENLIVDKIVKQSDSINSIDF